MGRGLNGGQLIRGRAAVFRVKKLVPTELG